MTESLQIDRLSCCYDEIPLFSPVSLALQAGEVCRVLGSNGSGKTTLLRTLAGLFGGFDGTFSVRPSLRCHYLGHKSGIRNELTALENLEFLTQYSATTGDIKQALAKVGLRGYEDSFTDELSAGQRRRVLLASVFCMRYDILLLDEPFTALDSEGVQLIGAALRQLADSGVTIIYSTHHADDVLLPDLTLSLEVPK